MTDETEGSNFDYLKAHHFGGALRMIAKGEYVSADELAHLLRNRGDIEVPDELLDYISAHLADEIKAPSGRPRRDEIYVRQREMIVAVEYNRLKIALSESSLSSKDLETYGDEDPKFKADHTPAERAASLVAGLWLDGPGSWRRVQNIASAQK